MPGVRPSTRDLCLHVVCNPADDACASVATRLCDVLQTLGDGADRLGEAPPLRQWSFEQWPPSQPPPTASVGQLVVFLGTADQLRAIDWHSDWGRYLANAPYSRIMMAVRVPFVEQTRPLPAHNQDWRTVVWSTTPPDARQPGPHLPPIGPATEVIAAALWMLVEALAVRPPDHLPEQSIRLPEVIDHTAEAAVHPPAPHVARRRATFQRRDRTLQSSSAALPDIERPGFPLRWSPADVALLDDTSPDAQRPSVRPRVLLGSTTQLTADTDLFGTGRLTVRAARSSAADIFLAAHLVAARQAWLEWTVRRSPPAAFAHRPEPSPHALHLLHAARFDQRPLLLPEPAPTPSEHRAMAERGLRNPMVTPATPHGHEALAEWTLVLVAPSLASTARWCAVLQQVFASSGAAVQMCEHPEQLSPPRTISPHTALVMVTPSTHETAWPGLRGYHLVVPPQPPARLHPPGNRPDASAPANPAVLLCASPWDAARAMVAALLQPPGAP